MKYRYSDDKNERDYIKKNELKVHYKMVQDEK